MKLPKTKAEWIAAAVHQWWIKAAITVLTACCGFMLAQGNALVEQKIRDTVKPAIDSMTRRIDTIEVSLKAIGDSQQVMQSQQNEFFGAMMDVFPGLKEEVKKRGEKNHEAAKKKAETDSLLNNLRRAGQ